MSRTSTAPREGNTIPLGEAWDSGMADWSATDRQTYANDLDTCSLLTVHDRASQSKSDRDPAPWVPAAAAATCRCIFVRGTLETRLACKVSSVR
ncbi:hypothetical protein ACFV0W_02330 [Streptomyces anulatus]